MLTLSYQLGQPEYYRQRYGLRALQGCVVGSGLGELDTSAYKCATSGAFYICNPTTSMARGQIISMQKAIDAFLLRLPLFRSPEIPIVDNPIGSSKSGYDGSVGPVTSGVGEVALIGASEVLKAAGAGDPPGSITIAMREFTDEKTRTENFTRYAPEITDFLNDITSRFDTLLAAINQNMAPGTRPIEVEPPPIPVPGDVQALVQKKPFPTLLVAAMAVGATALIGVAAYKAKYSKWGESKTASAVTGFGRYHRDHYRR
jgi:hypothetical protein